jgi:hypothetical protein
LEKSSKNYIRCEHEPSQAAVQGFPPHLLASCDGGFSTWWREMCELQAPFLLARFTRGMEGKGGVICESMLFNNGSSDWTQIQHEDEQWCSAPLLFRQGLPNSYWQLLASFGEFI